MSDNFDVGPAKGNPYFPEHHPLDFMTHQVMRKAVRSGLRLPYRLQLVDANEKLIKQSEIGLPPGASDGPILEEGKNCWEGRVEFEFPLTAKLSDANGGMCAYTLSTEQMLEWLEAAPTHADGTKDLAFSIDCSPLPYSWE